MEDEQVEAPAQGYLQRNLLTMRVVEATAQSYLQTNPRSRDGAEQEPKGAKVWIYFSFFAFSSPKHIRVRFLDFDSVDL